jgi:hypothetical protein
MAIPSTNEFLIRFPEFGEQSLSVVEGALAEAADAIPESVWGTRQFAAIGFLAAHLLATRTMQIGQQVGTPSGQTLGLQYTSTLYGQSYLDCRDSLALSGFAL